MAQTFNSFDGLKGLTRNEKNSGSLPPSIKRKEEKKLEDLKVEILRPEPKNRFVFHAGGKGATIFYKWFLQYSKSNTWIWKPLKEVKVSFPKVGAPDKFTPVTYSNEVVSYGEHVSEIYREIPLKELPKIGFNFEKVTPFPKNKAELEWQLKHGATYPNFEEADQFRIELEKLLRKVEISQDFLEELESLKDYQDDPKRLPVDFFKSWFNISEEEDKKYRMSWHIADKTVEEEESLIREAKEKHNIPSDTEDEDADLEGVIPGFDYYYDEYGMDYQTAYYKAEFVEKIVNSERYTEIVSSTENDIKKFQAESNELEIKVKEITSKWSYLPIPIVGQDDWLKVNFNGILNNYSVNSLPDWNFSDPNAIVFLPGRNEKGNNWDTEEYLDPNGDKLSNDFYYRTTHGKGCSVSREEFAKWKENCLGFSIIIDSTGKAYKYPPVNELVRVTDKNGNQIPVRVNEGIVIPSLMDGVYNIPKKYFITKILNCGYELLESRKGAAEIKLHRF
jgi:hypothetical protein